MSNDTPVRQVAALPVRRGPDGKPRVLLVTTLQTHRWIIPKGWPWPGEPDYVAAGEEAREEAGVLGEPNPVSIGTYCYDKRRSSGIVPVRVTVYVLNVREELQTWPEVAQRERAWFTLREAAAAVQEPELHELLLSLEGTDLGLEPAA
jgi:ADP-ribose pyrophosphatase YjhB (NUDIX family)